MHAHATSSARQDLCRAYAASQKRAGILEGHLKSWAGPHPSGYCHAKVLGLMFHVSNKKMCCSGAPLHRRYNPHSPLKKVDVEQLFWRADVVLLKLGEQTGACTAGGSIRML